MNGVKDLGTAVRTSDVANYGALSYRCFCQEFMARRHMAFSMEYGYWRSSFILGSLTVFRHSSHSLLVFLV